MKHFLLFFLLAFCLLSTLKAQTTIISSDINSYYSLGNTLISHQDTLTTTINIGTLGNNTWDFSFLGSHVAEPFTSVVPASSPFINDFPTANLVIKTTQEDEGMVIDLYSYVNLTQSSFIALGVEMQFLVGPFPYTSKLINTPGNTSIIFPLTYNTQWSDQHNYSASSYLNGNMVNSYTEIHSINYIVDAYGTMKMPSGDVVQALRLKTDDQYISTDDGTHHREISYDFITKSGFSVSVTALDTLAANNGVIEVEHVNYTIPGTVGVKDENQTASNYTLIQNYPNPFNPSTTIRFTVTDSNEEVAKINIFNSLGELVSVLSVNLHGKGTYEAVWNGTDTNGKSVASGVYLYSLNLGNRVLVKKMVLSK